MKDQYVLPEDVVEFYSLCGGASLFGSSAYPVQIVASDEVSPVNEAVFEGMRKDELIGSLGADHASWSWYTIGRADGDLAIDLDPHRLGKCYDCYWETHYTGESPLIANSFTQLLERLLTSGGAQPYWLREES